MDEEDIVELYDKLLSTACELKAATFPAFSSLGTTTSYYNDCRIFGLVRIAAYS